MELIKGKQYKIKTYKPDDIPFSWDKEHMSKAMGHIVTIRKISGDSVYLMPEKLFGGERFSNWIWYIDEFEEIATEWDE